jgi:alpha-glucoside transport system substrate-binding protein
VIERSDVKANLPEITGWAKVPVLAVGLVFIGVGIWIGVNLFVQSLPPASTAIQAPVSSPPNTDKPSTSSVPPTTTPPPEGPIPNVQPGPELAAAFRGEYKGKQVVFDGPFIKEDAQRFKDTLKPFEEATGITIEYIGNDQFENSITRRVEDGYAPDLADFPQPGLLASLAKTGKVIDLTTVISQTWLKQNYHPTWLQISQMPGPSSSIQAGVWWRANYKSLVWYPKPAFEAAGYKVPKTWDEMQQLMDDMVADGGTPWCIGIESGDATGWPATDWMEEIMLRTTSYDNYYKWTINELPFTDRVVKHAATIMSNIWFNNNYVLGGRTSILSTNFRDAPEPMFDDPPKCWLHKQGNFITSEFPPDKKFGIDYDVFYLPPIDPQYGKPVLMGGDIVAMFNGVHDRPEVRAVIQYLTLGESLKIWLSKGGTFSPHRDTPPIWYGNPAEQKIFDEISGYTTIGFDGSDLMLEPVGQGTFWMVMTRYVEGSVDLDQALEEIQQGWALGTP